MSQSCIEVETDDHTEENELTIVFGKWKHDIQALLGSIELSDALNSTFKLIITVASKATKVVLSPIEFLHHTTQNLLESNTHRENELNDSSTQQCSSVFDVFNFGKAFPMIFNTACGVKDDICNSVVCLLGLQSAGECSSEASHHHFPINEKESESDQNTVISEATSSTTETWISPSPSHFMQIFDLEIQHSQDMASGSSSVESMSPDPNSEHISYVEIDQEKGRNHLATTIDALVNTGTKIILADDISSNNSNIIRDVSLPCWKPEGSTAKFITKILGSSDTHDSSAVLGMLERETLVWSGNVKNGMKSPNGAGYSSKVPWFKSRGIVDGLSPRNLADILLDSSQVRRYNKYSKGRKDIEVFSEGIDTLDGMFGHGETKIVESSTKIPFSGNVLTMRTLIHARKLSLVEGLYHELHQDEGSYIIVSRTVSKTNPQDSKTGDKVNEVIWGINLLKCCEGDPQKTDLTNITHMNSKVPLMLQQKVGIMGCYDFLKNIRSMSSEQSEKL